MQAIQIQYIELKNPKNLPLLYFKGYFVDLVFISEMAKGKKNRKGDESDEG